MLTMNGIYHASFNSPQGGWSDAVLVLDDGKINGGDQGFTYLGAYQLLESQINMVIKVKQWNPSIQSLFGGITEFDLALSGLIQTGSFTVKGTVFLQPGLKVSVTGKKIGDLYGEEK